MLAFRSAAACSRRPEVVCHQSHDGHPEEDQKSVKKNSSSKFSCTCKRQPWSQLSDASFPNITFNSELLNIAFWAIDGTNFLSFKSRVCCENHVNLVSIFSSHHLWSQLMLQTRFKNSDSMGGSAPLKSSQVAMGPGLVPIKGGKQIELGQNRLVEAQPVSDLS